MSLSKINGGLLDVGGLVVAERERERERERSPRCAIKMKTHLK